MVRFIQGHLFRGFHTAVARMDVCIFSDLICTLGKWSWELQIDGKIVQSMVLRITMPVMCMAQGGGVGGSAF